LSIDRSDKDSNYYMGLIYLLGLGVDVSIPKSINFFEVGKNDSRSLNALGYIYYKAPHFYESDP
jgi:TPR repeat protein